MEAHREKTPVFVKEVPVETKQPEKVDKIQEIINKVSKKSAKKQHIEPAMSTKSPRISKEERKAAKI